MRSFALLSLFVAALALSCATTRNTGVSDAGIEGGASTTRADGATSEEEQDAAKKKDSGTKKDTGTTTDEDSGSVDIDAGDPTTCAPGDVSGFTPNWVPPTATHQGACTTTQVADVINCLFNAGANQTACQTTLATACATCAMSNSTASAYGPLVITPDSLVTLNLAGCIARLENNITATGCGAKVQASRQCTEAACLANCPVPANDSVALDARNACEDAARTGDCAAYESAAACADTSLQGQAAACGQGATFEDVARSLITIFCGP